MDSCSMKVPRGSGQHSLQYHIYLIPKDVELLGASAFAYRTGLYIVADRVEEDGVEVQAEGIA